MKTPKLHLITLAPPHYRTASVAEPDCASQLVNLPAEAIPAASAQPLTRIGYLDGWRGLAILLVLLHHFFETELGAINLGRQGVNLFFCLSGLLMGQILFIKKTNLKTFYKRRVSRILPSFWLYISVVYGVGLAYGMTIDWLGVASTLAFLRSYYPYFPDLFNTGFPIAHIWSLNVEEHCYVLLSLLALSPYLRARAGLYLLLLGGLSIAIYMGYVFIPALKPNTIDWIRTESAMSFLVISAGYTLLSKHMAHFVKPWMPLAALALSVLLQAKTFAWLWLGSAIVSPFLLAFTVNHLAEAPLLLRQVLSFRPLRWLGIGSYSIYLWQQPFYIYANEHFHDAVLWKGFFFVLTLAVGSALYYCFEDPVRRYLNAVW